MDMVLKRRLIGASILIALAVIFVPMLLVDPDSVDDGMGESVEVPPMPESGGEVRRIPLDPDAARVSESGPARDRRAPPAPLERSSVDRGQQAEPDRQPAASGGEIAAEATQTGEPASAESETTERQPPEHEIVLRPELAQVDRDADTEAAAGNGEAGGDDTGHDATAAAETAPEPVAAPVDAGDESSDISLGDYIVQVASFGAEASANRVREQLEALGHIVNRDEIVRGDTLLYRLRTGPYPNRGAAERAMEQIRTTVSGVNPIVREIDAELHSEGEGGFAVQVGSFVGQDNAEGETARLAELGFEAQRFSEQVGERTIWRVVVGPVAGRDEAEALKQRLTDEAGVEGLVVSYP